MTDLKDKRKKNDDKKSLKWILSVAKPQFPVIIAIIIGIKIINDNQAIDLEELTQVTVAVRGRKRGFLS